MSVSKYLKILFIILLLAGCSKKNRDVSPDADEVIESSENAKKYPSFLETAEPFYPLKETIINCKLPTKRI